MTDSSSRNTKLVIASALAGASGIGTLFFPSLSILSANAFIAAIQVAVSAPLLPGLIGAMAVSGNVHVFSFWLAAPINALIYFGLGWVGCSLLIRFKAKS